LDKLDKRTSKFEMKLLKCLIFKILIIIELITRTGTIKEVADGVKPEINIF